MTGVPMNLTDPDQAALHRLITVDCYGDAMFRYSSLFRSRWLALFWSVGIVWSAVSFVGSQDEGDDGAATNSSAADDAANLNELQALVGKLKSS